MRRFLYSFVLLVLFCSEVFAAQKQVDIYITSWCPYCRKLENFLKQNKIKYIRHDIESDAASNEAFEQMGGNGIPLVRVDKDVIHGYDPEAIVEALQAKVQD